MENEQRMSCFARMLDVRGYVIAARRSMAQTDPGGALAAMIIFGIIAMPLMMIWVSFDLMSTWDFTTGLRNATESVVYDTSAMAEGFLGLSIGAALTGLVFTSFTLLPSLFELAFPMVSHPLLNIVLLSSIVFDYVTDWGKASELAANWTDNPTVGFIYTALTCLFLSVCVQALLAFCITVVVFGGLRIVRGGVRQVQAVVVDR